MQKRIWDNWLPGKILTKHIDGIVQDWSISIANVGYWKYCSLPLISVVPLTNMD